MPDGNVKVTSKREPMNHRKFHTRRVMDYDIGHLVKSPCRDCAIRYQFPRCSATCDILDRVQTYLSQSISSCRSFSALEPYLIHLDERPSK